MAMITIKCPNCGKDTKVDDEKPFAFCMECGGRIDLKALKNSSEKSPDQQNKAEDKSLNNLEDGLKEVAFYYDMSKQKNEMRHPEQTPEFYEKAQEKAIALSQKFPDDYRVWWQLCRPLDFSDPAHTCDFENNYGISAKYFDQALDLADLKTKKELIDARENYNKIKSSAIEQHKKQAEDERKAKEAEQQKKQEEERKKQEAEQLKQQEEERKKQEAEQQRRQEEERKRQEAERQEKERKEAEEKARIAEKEKRKQEKALKAAEAAPRRHKIAFILAILAWVSYPTIVLPFVFAIISLVIIKNEKLPDGKPKYPKMIISDILAMVAIVVSIVLIVVFTT